MTKILTGGLLLAAMLTCTALPSQATCAWVLWFRGLEDVKKPERYPNLTADQIRAFNDRTRWNLEAVYSTAEECQAHIARSVARFSQPGGDQKLTESSVGINSGFTVHDSDSIRFRHDWACLPDTLNPRGIKY